VLLAGGLVYTLRRPRTDRTRAALILWGSWLVVTGLAISLGQGIIHEYYTVALVPAIGALVGIGAAFMWRHRDTGFARVTLALAMAATAIWASVLLDRTPTWAPGLRPVVLILGLGLSIALLVPTTRRVGLAIVGAAVVVGLAAPTAYSLSTVRTSHAGALPTAGPAGASRGFGPGGGFRGAGRFGGGPPGLGAAGNPGGIPGAMPGGAGNGPPGMGGGGGLGGLLNGSSVGAALETKLRAGSDGYRWVAAAVGANNAASYQLASDQPVMAIGGFNGSDPAPSLAEFKAYVAGGDVHYFIGGGAGGFGGASGTSSAISSWVSSHFESSTVSGVTLYDLTAPTS
jgi:4-amino-4-deoxy-L-arabinose transferase-like glycosyltransferase